MSWSKKSNDMFWAFIIVMVVLAVMPFEKVKKGSGPMRFILFLFFAFIIGWFAFTVLRPDAETRCTNAGGKYSHYHEGCIRTGIYLKQNGGRL